MTRWWYGMNDVERSHLTRFGLMLLLFWIGIVASCLVQGCATTGTKPSVPAGCEDSVIYGSIQNPQVASAAALIAVTEAVRAYPLARIPVVMACKALMACLEDSQLTYADLLRVVAEQDNFIANEVGQRVALYGELFMPLAGEGFGTVAVSKCDRDFLMAHFTKQLKYLGEGID